MNSLFNYNFASINKKKESYKIAYIDINPYKSEKVVLCIHGITRNCRDFDYLTNYLVTHMHYRVLLIDIVGRGKSDWLINKEDYTYTTYIEDIIQVLQILKIHSLSIVGTSMGAALAMLLAYSFPKLVQNIVINDLGAHIKYENLLSLMDHISMYPTFKTYEGAKAFVTKYFERSGIVKNEHIEHILKHQLIFSEQDKNFSFSYDQHVIISFKKYLIKNSKDLDNWDIWNSINSPTLILRAEKSKILTYETANLMHIGKKNATLVEFPNIDHAPSLFEEEHILCIAEWLKKFS